MMIALTLARPLALARLRGTSRVALLWAVVVAAEAAALLAFGPGSATDDATADDTALAIETIALSP